MVSTLAVTAVLIGSFQGGEVTVGGMASSEVMYSADNNETGTWSATLTPSSASDPWYSRLEISNPSYSGPVIITWQLQQETGPSTWTDVGASTTTNMTLSGAAEDVYATGDGGNSGNRDWGQDVSSPGTYRVIVRVDT